MHAIAAKFELLQSTEHEKRDFRYFERRRTMRGYLMLKFGHLLDIDASNRCMHMHHSTEQVGMTKMTCFCFERQ